MRSSFSKKHSFIRNKGFAAKFAQSVHVQTLLMARSAHVVFLSVLCGSNFSHCFLKKGTIIIFYSFTNIHPPTCV